MGHDVTGDAGLPYVHDTTGDFGPYKLWKLRQEEKLKAHVPAQKAEQPIAPAYEQQQKHQNYQQPQTYQRQTQAYQQPNQSLPTAPNLPTAPAPTVLLSAA